MSSPTDGGITGFEVTKRLNDPGSTFTLNYSTTDHPQYFRSGEIIDFGLVDILDPNNISVFKGFIQNAERDHKSADATTILTGRDIGYFLTRQWFKWDCALPPTTPATSTNINTILSDILVNTNMKIGRGQPSLANINLTNEYGKTNWFCTDWKKKNEVLEGLFRIYAKIQGLKKVRWFIDNGGNLRWFEIGNRNQPLNVVSDEQIFDGNAVINLTFRDNSENIVNYLWGSAGDKGQYTTVQYDNDSINGYTDSHGKHHPPYGLLEGDPINDSSLTQQELDTKVAEELNMKSAPIYSATLELLNYPHAEPGHLYQFPDDPYLPDELFTVVDVTLTGKPGNYKSTLNMTTDQSVISPPTAFDVIKTITQTIMDDGATQIATVIDVDYDNQLALVQPDGSTSLVITKYV